MTTTFVRYALMGLILLIPLISEAQEEADSMIVNVGKSRIIFIIKDKSDLEKMEQYDLNSILHQLRLKLINDTTAQPLQTEREDSISLSDTTIVIDPDNDRQVEDNQEVDEYGHTSEDKNHYRHKRRKGTGHFFNVDLGTNNYLEDGAFPDESNAPYTVRPFGSWYVGISSVNQTHIGGPLYLEWGPSISWYNFKFQNDRMRVFDTPDGVIFTEDTNHVDADFKKSKLTVAYVNFSVVPMLGFGKSGKRNWWDWNDKNDDSRGFRIGVGGYGGYRIGSYSKIVFKNGDKEKDKDKDNFHLNNFRYGMRLQMGYRGTDLFFNYDMNELFSNGNGPALNAFSFGLIL